MRERLPLPDQGYLLSLFTVVNGVLCYSETLQPSGRIYERGYSRTRIGRRMIFDHRIVFKMYNGFCPDNIDHIDGVRSNNSIHNLRPATLSQNQWNMRIRETELSFKGVYLDKRRNRYGARIKKNGIMTYLGMYSNPIDAAKAYDSAAVVMFGEFAATNSSLGAY